MNEGVDRQLLARFVERVRSGDLDSVAAGELRPPGGDSIIDSAELTAAGDVDGLGVVILAGGMATRFGGVVKALVEVAQSKSFIDLKVEQIKKLESALAIEIPIYVMTSFATTAAIEQWLAASGLSGIHIFEQCRSKRILTDGSLLAQHGDYATGHGDFGHAFVASGLKSHFEESGGQILSISNVDNLGATLEPALAEALDMAPLVFEVAPKYEGDAGGAPAMLDGRPEVIEGFRFPADFDQTRISVFNTNTCWLKSEALSGDEALDYFPVKKKVAGQEVIQFERLIGQLSHHIDTAFLEVPRAGEHSRFMPIKTPTDLDSMRPQIITRLKELF